MVVCGRLLVVYGGLLSFPDDLWSLPVLETAKV